jgi:hypothetical protein
MHLIEKYLPEFDVRSYYETAVAAPASAVFESIWNLDMSDSWIVRLLFAIRGLPRQTLTLKGFMQGGFFLLEERPNEEIVFGGAGRFWTRHADFQVLDSTGFREFESKGYAKVAGNFRVVPVNAGRAIVCTETRIQCFGRSGRRRFKFYWFVIRPFSGLVRKEMLRLIKKGSEE